MTSDLIVDPQIRSWVFLPIILMTFLMGILKHYVSILFTPQKKTDLEQCKDHHIIWRCRLIREHAHYIPSSSFLIRRTAFNKKEGYITSKQRSMVPPMTDTTLMTDYLKGNFTNMVPMVFIGAWINWMLSGFITTRIPFPLTPSFRMMLQKGIELTDLDASWVSSASWYFLNVFGLRSIYALALGENHSADLQRDVEELTTVESAAVDVHAVFKAEWEALELVNHRWVIADAAGCLLREEEGGS